MYATVGLFLACDTRDSVSFRVHFDDITFLAKNVIPVEKEDFATKLYNLIEQTV